MNIGDRVRVLHGTEEGIVTKVVDNKTVEIEINEGFVFPVLVSDLVRITEHEDQYFTEEKISEKVSTSKEVHADKGIFLALELDEKADRYRLQLINNTDLDIVAAIFKKEGKLKYGGLFRGLVNKRSASQIAFFNTSGLSNFSELYCQILYFNQDPGPLKVPLERQVRISGLLATNKNMGAPVINTPAWLKQLDDKGENQNNISPLDADDIAKKPPDQVDLHAEAIDIDMRNLSPGEILEEQVRAFNEALDKALIFGLPEITFIHGVGQGTLKNRIIKEIKNRTGISYWEDALKEKFGHGAIRIVFR